MSQDKDQSIELLPIDKISVLNPRSRNKRIHREIISSIESVGLKRPITVSPHNGSDPVRYDLVCGEGRLEAFRILGETHIPAIIVSASEADCYIMSLVENIARRQHRPIDIMHEIGSLDKRGYSDIEIASKIGVTVSWVGMVLTLLNNGEERLVSAVETGLIPIGFAIDIARADDSEVQNLLMDAYSSGQIKGKKLARVRRMLDQRTKRSKNLATTKLGRKNMPRKITSKDLFRLYQCEAEKQRILVKKSDFAQAKLLFIIESLKDLLKDEGFSTLLRAERLDTLPGALADRMKRNIYDVNRG